MKSLIAFASVLALSVPRPWPPRVTFLTSRLAKMGLCRDVGHG